MNVDFQVGIIGAGFAGLVAALRLKKSGFTSFTILERAAEIGGTWRENVYPGCTCDVASPLYSFADELNPEWSRLYAGQPEILAYLKKVVANNGVDSHIRFNTDVVEANFLATEGCWQLTDRQGRRITVNVLLLCVGQLNRPYVPDFPGLASFTGKHFHSAQWDTAFDIKGKRVAVIGTGASAIQIIPSIATEVAALTVFQRSPGWIQYKFNNKISPLVKWIYRKIPLLLKIRRELVYWFNEFIGLGLIGYRPINQLLSYISLLKLRLEVKDPEVRRKLTPDYTIGCKRILLSNEYYPTFNHSNVALVASPIERFTAQGVLTEDGREYPLDAVVFATGFEVADMEFYMKIRGLHGRSLVEEWRQKGAEAYLGTTVAGYPNFAFILGPNTGLGHSSVIHMMESQMTYVMQYIQFMMSCGSGCFLDVKEEEQQAYNQKIEKQFEHTVWNSGCRSWYINRHGKITTLYPRLMLTFRKETRHFKPEVYHVFRQPVSTIIPASIAH